MTSTHRDLPVPDEALDAWVRWTRDPLARVPTIENMTAAVTAIASAVVAAVLREEAEALTRRTTDWWALCREYDQTPDPDEQQMMTGLGEAASRLRARADELDPR